MNFTLIHANYSGEPRGGEDAAAVEYSRLMAELSIVRGARYYHYGTYRYEKVDFEGFRYDHLDDAANYARHRRCFNASH